MNRTIRYYAFAATPDHRWLEEIMVEMQPGRFRDRVETKTGTIYRTTREAERAVARKNGAA